MNINETIKELEAALVNAKAEQSNLKACMQIGCIEHRGLRIVGDDKVGAIWVAVGTKQPDGKTYLGFAHIEALKAGDMLQFNCDDDIALLKNVAGQYANLAKQGKPALGNIRFESKRWVDAVRLDLMGKRIASVEQILSGLVTKA